MATPFEALQNRATSLGNTLDSSRTAYAPNTLPTSRDLSTDKQLSAANKAIEDLRSKQIRNKWYGPTTDVPQEDTSNSDGLIMSGIKALQRPLNAIVGTAQYALGKGSQPSLTGNINNAMKTGLMSGDVLKQLGASRAVQIPLGFALDVMFDPVNWLTAGTEALIPRAIAPLAREGMKGVGLIKGGIEEGGLQSAIQATGTGLASNLARKASTTMNFMPFVKKISQITPKAAEEGTKLGFGDAYRNLLIKGSSKYTNLASKLGEKAVAGAEKYDSLLGRNVYDKLGEGILGQPSGYLGGGVEDLVRKAPSVSFFGKMTPTGDQIADFFKYSPKKAADIADLKDKVINLARSKGAILTRNAEGANFQSIDDFLKPGATVTLKDKIGEVMNTTIRDADGSIKPEYAGQATVADTFENAQTLLEAAKEDYNLKHLTEAYKVTPAGKTGVQWYDDVIDKLKSTTVDDVLHARLGTGDTLEGIKTEADDLVKTWNSYDGIKDLKPLEKILNAQQGLISIFKSAKVPMNVASHVVANIGNFFMGAMMGLPMWEPEYLASMTRSNLLVKGRLGSQGFKDMFFGDVNSLIDLADNNPTRFKQLTGMDPSEIARKLSTEEKIRDVLNAKSTKNEVLKVLQQAADSIEEGVARGEKLSSFAKAAEDAAKVESESKMNARIMKAESIKNRPMTVSEQLSKMTKEAPIRRSEEFGSFTGSEITHNARLDKIKGFLAKEAEAHPYNPVIRAANTLVNSMPRWYEHIDQTFKIGTADYLTRIGLTEQQLLTVSRTVPTTQADLLEPIISGGQKLYRLTPLKASEVATEAFMNYAAMPDFVRVMRALPIVGSPFLSFPYAMAIKTAKTAINNPAVFNKVGFMLNEMNVARSPQEKAAMEEKYNQYLKSPTVVKMFGMWNTNVKNFIPYYQMNMFNPSERKYTGNSFGSEMLKLSDKFPILQDPVGSVIKDYFIQPWLLSGSGEVSQGQFGEPIFPSFDEKGKKITPSLGTKAFYGGRAIAESVVPGALGYAGLANVPGEMSPGFVNAIPSYGFRNLANATQGRSSVGAMTKEDAVRKTLRSLLGRSGIPAYTLDVTKTSTK